MATANKGFDEDPIPGTSFTRLLDSGDHASLDMVETGSFIFPAEKAPKMLCFGNPCNQVAKGVGEYGMIAQRSGITASDSSSVSSSNHSSSTGSFSNPKSKSQSGEAKTEQKKRNESSVGSVPSSSLGSGASGDYRKTSKKVKTENLASKGPAKARKEKLGERITALQQLVSPFGKTDTASVLHEAMGYIRFLHDQVQVLSSPYMQRLSSSGHGRNLHERGEEEESKYELRSRGLCLVPVACTVHMANSNGADYWSLAMASNSNPKQ
ncbi:transcription factor bHLH113-like isoform X2 [Macadamia integrifolia]|uniref:transcription factor bHLH113-like isoform X2 n=1 Tax=Macadamia integrifolia TaxID=60698 RepID=UPI001C502415|nr:transcription factor bHLH113-like isoform X2 [Macadamia integrifolia]